MKKPVTNDFKPSKPFINILMQIFMKQKKLLSLLAIAAIVAVSCQSKEEYFDKETTTPAEVVTLQLSPVLPNSIVPLSADGGTALDDASYSLRYILEVWTDAGAFETRKVELATSYATPVNFVINDLPARAYRFVFWADFVTKNSTSDLIYKTDNTEGLKNIEWTPANNAYAIADDRRDAFYAAADIDLTTGSAAQQVTLRRPLGKLRVLATDIETAISNGVIGTPVKATLTYTHATPAVFRKGFNASTGLSTTATISASGALECVPVKLTGATTVEGETYTDAWLIAFDYFFPADDLTAVSFKIQLYDASQTALLAEPKEVTNVPIDRNKLTTAIGALFAKYNAEMTVSIDDEFNKLELDETKILAGYGADTYEINVTSNKHAWTAAVNPEAAGWCTLSTGTGFGSGQVTASITGNGNPAEARTATITFTLGDLVKEVVLTQAKNPTLATLCTKCMWDGSAWVDGYVTTYPYPFDGGEAVKVKGNADHTVFGATSDVDGRANTALITSTASAAQTCRNLGTGWYLPAYEEMYNISGGNSTWAGVTGPPLNGLSGANLLTGVTDVVLTSTEFLNSLGRYYRDPENLAPNELAITCNKGGDLMYGFKTNNIQLVCVWQPE
jgi:hypothetical protein